MSDQPPFRFTPQVGILVAIVLLALTIPLALVGLYFRKAPERASVNAPDTSAILAPMQQSLESIANEKLAADGLTFDQDSAIRLEPKSGETLRQCSERLLAAVAKANGSALETSAEANDSTASWIVTIPKSGVSKFRLLLGLDALAITTPESEWQGTEIFRVEILRPARKP